MITSNNLIPVTISEKFPFSSSKEKQHPSKIRNTRKKKKTVSDSANCKRTSLLSYKMRYQKGKKKKTKTQTCVALKCVQTSSSFPKFKG